MNIKHMVGGALAAVFLAVTSQAYAQDEVIEKRKKLMKSTSAANKAVKTAVEKKNFDTVKTKAAAIADNMTQVPKLFPKGSTSPDSRAKPIIWEKWDEFSQEADKVKMAANELAEAAGAKDEAQVQEKAKALGKVCGNCHKTFRAPKKKK